MNTGMERFEMENDDSGAEERGKRRGTDDVPILLTAKEAAALCMMSDSYFYRLTRKGLAPEPVRAGNVRRWRRSDLAQWVAEGCPKNGNKRGE